MFVNINGISAAKRGNGSSGQFATWQKQVRLSIKETVIDSTLTNWAVLIDETVLPTNIWTIALNGGGDLRFTSDRNGDNWLNCEVVTFNTATQKAEIYVKVPTVSSSVNTPVYLFYGKSGQTQPAVNATGGRNGTWDSDYLGVFHGNVSTDSTGNSSVASSSFTSVTGKVGNAYRMNGTTDYIALGIPSNGTSTYNGCSVEAWAKIDTISVDQSFLSQDETPIGTFRYSQFSTNRQRLAIEGNVTAAQSFGSGVDLAVGVWAGISMVYDKANTNAIARKNYSNSDTLNYSVVQDFNGNDTYSVGSRFWTLAGGRDRYYDGDIDEVRYSKVVRSNAYLRANYENQNLVTAAVQLESYVF
jgi:hypothetical protein